jgi:hypothetical protein
MSLYHVWYAVDQILKLADCVLPAIAAPCYRIEPPPCDVQVATVAPVRFHRLPPRITSDGVRRAAASVAKAAKAAGRVARPAKTTIYAGAQQRGRLPMRCCACSLLKRLICSRMSCLVALPLPCMGPDVSLAGAM